MRSAKRIAHTNDLIDFISKMISDDPNSRPSIDNVGAFIRSHRYDTIDDLKRLSAKDLGINEDLQSIEGSRIASDAKKRANKFMNCPFSRVDIMNSIENLTSYAELSKGTKMISKRVHDQVWKIASKYLFFKFRETHSNVGHLQQPACCEHRFEIQ